MIDRRMMSRRAMECEREGDCSFNRTAKALIVGLMIVNVITLFIFLMKG